MIMRRLLLLHSALWLSELGMTLRRAKIVEELSEEEEEGDYWDAEE
jgi:hypothetical protein